MCVGFTNGYADFPSWRSDAALAAMVPGSAIGFDRRALYHFAVFLGWAWPRGGGSAGEPTPQPLPLLCHLSGDPSTRPVASVRLDDVRDIVQGSSVRVYRCRCPASERARVVRQCLGRVGETGYNAATNNCEHFVRGVITGRSVSYQAVWTLVAPFVQLPRLALGAGGVVGPALMLSRGAATRRLEGYSSLGLIDPEANLLAICQTRGGLEATVQESHCCTRCFTGANALAVQELHHCITCGIIGAASAVCKMCIRSCHQGCLTRKLVTRTAGFCNCYCCL